MIAVQPPEVSKKVLNQWSDDGRTLNGCCVQSGAVLAANAAVVPQKFVRENSVPFGPPPRCAYQLYELLKARLTSKARSAREYELAVREAARLAGV